MIAANPPARRPEVRSLIGDVQTVGEQLRAVDAAVQTVMVGQERAIEAMLVAVVCGGHVLLEDVPGTGKTTLVKTLAAALGCSFRRIQFTPDLLPGDVTGMSVYDQRQADFTFRAGPVFSQFLLADEINRASPKTQSALLEAMAERQVTADGTTHPLPSPFLVMATQNPIDFDGTYPLPEAQMDRFLLQIRLGYLDEEHEVEMLSRALGSVDPSSVSAVAGPEDLLRWQQARRDVEVHPDIRRYCVRIVQATRQQRQLRLGASPRGTINLAIAAQARALLDGRDHVIPDDVQDMADAVLTHRLLIEPSARLDGAQAPAILRAALASVKVPA